MAGAKRDLKEATAQVNLPFVYREYGPERLKEVLHKMYLIRRFEEGAEESYMRGLIHGTMHLSIGQEASAVGICMPLSDDDQITSTHRGHGHCIAKGAEVSGMFAEFFGKDDRLLPRPRRLDAHRRRRKAAIWAPTASSAAACRSRSARRWPPRRMKQRRGASSSFFGDGANNEGAFHEALNMASIWKLPVVFVCENNGYAHVDVDTRARRRCTNVADRAAAYAMPGVTVDGNDLLGGRRAASREAVDRARAGEGPTLIECQDLPHPRPLEERPQPVPHQGGDRRLDASATRSRCFERELVAHGDHRPTTASRRSRESVEQARSSDALEFAKESPIARRPRNRHVDVYTDEPRADGTTPRELTYAEAIREAHGDRDGGAIERVFLIGEDIGVYGGAFGVTGDLVERFGTERVIDTPISRARRRRRRRRRGADRHAADASSSSSRISSTLAMEQIVNQAAKIRFMFGGKVSVPMVVRLPAGLRHRRRRAAQPEPRGVVRAMCRA